MVKTTQTFVTWFSLIISAHPYCARKFTPHVMCERAIVKGARADDHCHSFAWI